MKLPVPSEIFEGRYRVDGVLGEGGFATVFAAEEIAVGRKVALKILKAGPQGYDEELQRRFRRELETLAQLRSPHTVVMLNHGQASSGLLYVVFEYLEGQELAELLRHRGQLDGPEIEHILRQLLDSLGEAHRHGLLHRDLKPENIIVYEHRGDPLRVKLIDFGIARPLGHGSPSITKTGELIGTPRYMSPEQLTERPLTAASDLYSLGMIAFEMALGRDALQGGAWGDQLDRLMSGHVFSVPELRRVGPNLHAVISKMSARAPEDRYQSAAQVLAALAPQVAAPRPDVPTPTAEPRRQPGIGIAIALVLGVVVAVGAVLTALPEAQDPPPIRPPIALPVGKPAGPAKPAPPSDPPKMEVADAGVTPDLADIDFGMYATEGCNLKPLPGSVHESSSSVHVPAGLEHGRPAPVVILLRDYGVDRKAFMVGSGFIELSEKHGFLVLAPEGRRGIGVGGGIWKRPTNLVGRLVDRMAQFYCVDRSRIFVVGHGLGANGATILACKEFAAGIALTSNVPAAPGRLCRNGVPNDVPVPAINLVPRNTRHHRPFGGGVNCKGDPSGETSTFEDAQRVWAEARGCTTTDPVFRPDEPTSRCREWTCSNGAYKSCLLDGGHPWPGFPPRTLGDEHKCDGDAPDFDSAKTIWEFFAGLPPLRRVPSE